MPKLRQHAEQSGNQMDIQSVADMEQFVDRLDKKFMTYNYRQIAIQTAPQIRMIQNVNQALAEKFKVLFSQVFLYGKIRWLLPSL